MSKIIQYFRDATRNIKIFYIIGYASLIFDKMSRDNSITFMIMAIIILIIMGLDFILSLYNLFKDLNE